jgi:hypothetical protein
MGNTDNRKKSSKRIIEDSRLFTLEVVLWGGPVTDEFIERNPDVSRTVQIKGNQTLQALHRIIQEAYDFDDDHLYEFQFGKRPEARDAVRYVLPSVRENSIFPGARRDRSLKSAVIESLDLYVRKTFFYMFDYGDCWWFKIKVKKIEEQAPPGRFPTIIGAVGANPPQYPDYDEDEDDYDDEEEDDWEDDVEDDMEDEEDENGG